MDAVAPKFLMSFGNAERLGVLEKFRFFTPALLYLYAGFDDQPLLQFMEEHSGTIHYLHYCFRRPIFRGFDAPNGDRQWNNVLWAIEAEAYEAFENFMLSVAISNRDTGVVNRIAVQELLVPDPLFVAKANGVSPVAPLLPVTVFAVDGSDRIVAVSLPANTALEMPRLRIYPPKLRTIRFAKAALAGDNPAPYLALPAADTQGVSMRLKDFGAESAEHQQELLRSVEQYRKEIP